MSNLHLIWAACGVILGLVAALIGGIGAGDPEGRGAPFAFLALGGIVVALVSGSYEVCRLSVFIVHLV